MITSKCTLTIDLGIIRDNYRTLQKICTLTEVGAAVKANSYGLGAEQISPILANLGCKYFFVATTDEGVTLKERFNKENLNHKNLNICVLNGYFTADQEEFIKYDLIPVLNSFQQSELWRNLGYQLNRKLPCFLHIDTGMNRFGIPEEEINHLIRSTQELEVLCIMSHLSSSEEPDNEINKEQLLKFKQLASLFPDTKKSLANSSGIFLGPGYHFDLARPGVAIYGVNPTPYLSESLIKNPITLKAPIIQIKSLDKGQHVGYNRTYELEENHLIATLPLGYADGYPRSLSNKGIVFINDKPAPVIGRVSMDLITVDVTKIPPEDLFLGQTVEIIGKNMSLDKIANLAGTNGYEILTMLGNRYHKIYKY